MPRPKDSYEEVREGIEGNLGLLGNSLVLLELVRNRVQFFAKRSRHSELLQPAVDDLDTMEKLIRQVQSRLSSRNHEIQ